MATIDTARTQAPRADGAGGETFEVRNPATGEVIATPPAHDAAHVAEVARRLRGAQPEWEALGYEGRFRWLSRWRDWTFDNADRISEVLISETGKVRQDAGFEIPYLADTINFYGKNA